MYLQYVHVKIYQSDLAASMDVFPSCTCEPGVIRVIQSSRQPKTLSGVGPAFGTEYKVQGDARVV